MPIFDAKYILLTNKTALKPIKTLKYLISMSESINNLLNVRACPMAVPLKGGI